MAAICGVATITVSTLSFSMMTLASTAFVFAQFLLTRPLTALAVPRSIHAISLAMAIFSTVLPTWLIAESIVAVSLNEGGVAALRVPQEGIADYPKVADTLVRLIQAD